MAKSSRRQKRKGAERMLRAVLHPAAWKTVMRRKHRGKGLPKETGNKFPSLDTELCERLPQDPIEMVLDRLPFRHLVACRTVCKRWNAYILSKRSPPAPVSKTTLVYFPPNGDFQLQSLTVYNAKAKNWDKICLSFLADGGISDSHSLVASDGGLLCFSNSSLTSFVVCNPVSKQWRRLELPTSVLPQLPGMEIKGCPYDHVLVGMVVNEEDGNYKLVVAGLLPMMIACKRIVTSRKKRRKKRFFSNLEANSRRCFVYDSCSGLWNEAPRVPLLPIWFDNSEIDEYLETFRPWSNKCARRGVTSNGNLYWSATEENWVDSNLVAVLRFDVKRSKWSLTQVDVDDASILGVLDGIQNLVLLDGKVLLVNLSDATEETFDHSYDPFGRLPWFLGFKNEILPTDWECTIFEVQEMPPREPTDWERRNFEVPDVGSNVQIKKGTLPEALYDLKCTEQFTSNNDHQYGCVGQGTSLFVMYQVIDKDSFCTRKNGISRWSNKMHGWKVLHFDSKRKSCVWLPQFDTDLEEKYPVSWWTLRPSLRVLV